MAMLDVEALKTSKNQSEDIKSALETVKESDAYLFDSDEPFRNPVGSTGGGAGAGWIALKYAERLGETRSE